MAKEAQFLPISSGLPQTPWRVNIPASLSASGKRERRFFTTKVAAETFAKNEKTRIANFGISETNLTPNEREAAAAALRLLGEGSPQRLVEIVEQHLAREKARTASITFESLKTEFKNSKKHRSAAYLRQIRQAFTKLDHLGKTKVSDISATDIEEALAGMAETNRNLHLRVLRAAFNYAMKKQWAAKNPVDALDFASERHGEVEVLTNRQAAKLLVASRRLDPELLPYTLFGMFAGIRPEELQRMRWEHVKLDEHHIILPADVTKTGRRRVVDLEPALATWLEWFIEDRGDQKGLVTPKRNLRKRLRAIRKKAGIINWVQDVMRHSYASNWLALHGDIDRLLLNLGHYSPKVLWEHYHKAVLRKDAEKFWALVPKKKDSPQAAP
jgi:integrase